MKTSRQSSVCSIMLRGTLGCAALLSLSAAYAAPQAHQVAAGDTLIALSKQYNVSVPDIAKANDITPKTTIVIGDTLTIPTASSTAAKKAENKRVKNTANSARYQIQSGDTLMAIAKRYNVSVDALTDANDITATTVIRTGDTLLLPKNAKTAPAVPTVKAPVPTPKPSATTAPVATAVATSSDIPDTYIVQAGDTLISIAKRYGLAYKDIASASGIEPNAMLQIGQTLRLTPAPAQKAAPPQTTAMSVVDDDTY